MSLTPEELAAMDVTADLANRLARIIGQGPSRPADLAEMVSHIHVIQQAILAQAAARLYPDQFRLLGEVVPAAGTHPRSPEPAGQPGRCRSVTVGG